MVVLVDNGAAGAAGAGLGEVGAGGEGVMVDQETGAVRPSRLSALAPFTALIITRLPQPVPLYFPVRFFSSAPSSFRR